MPNENILSSKLLASEMYFRYVKAIKDLINLSKLSKLFIARQYTCTLSVSLMI